MCENLQKCLGQSSTAVETEKPEQVLLQLETVALLLTGFECCDWGHVLRSLEYHLSHDHVSSCQGGRPVCSEGQRSVFNIWNGTTQGLIDFEVVFFFNLQMMGHKNFLHNHITSKWNVFQNLLSNWKLLYF